MARVDTMNASKRMYQAVGQVIAAAVESQVSLPEIIGILELRKLELQQAAAKQAQRAVVPVKFDLKPPGGG